MVYFAGKEKEPHNISLPKGLGVTSYLKKEFHLKVALMLSFCRTFQLYQSAFTWSIFMVSNLPVLTLKEHFPPSTKAIRSPSDVFFSFPKSNLI